MPDGVLLYGAYGYTGRLIAEAAAARGLRPVLSGRDGARVAALAADMALEARPVDLSDPAALREALSGIAVVIHAAGPFSETSAPMVAACLATGTHYLDITGEPDVFEAVLARHADARAAGVMLLPGCGFDVVPSDCAAAIAAKALPGAARLTLSIAAMGRLSRGTLRTALGPYAAMNPLIRRDGALVERADRPVREVDFGEIRRKVAAQTWGDVVTAHLSTGIPDIEVFMSLTPAADRLAAAPGWLRRIFASPAAAPLRRAFLNRQPLGPDSVERAEGAAWIRADAETASGDRATAILRTPEPYSFTATSVCHIADRVLVGGAAPGFQTPATAFGATLVLDMPGCRRITAPRDGNRSVNSA